MRHMETSEYPMDGAACKVEREETVLQQRLRFWESRAEGLHRLVLGAGLSLSQVTPADGVVGVKRMPHFDYPVTRVDPLVAAP